MNRDADALCRRAGPPVGAEPSPSLRFRPDGGRYHCGETDISKSSRGRDIVSV